VLVAGVGNVFLGDDGFGVAVAERLAGEPLPDGVRVEDFGIRGVHLAYELLNGYDLAILVDAAPRGGAPGTVYVIEPEQGASAGAWPVPPIDGHGMHPEAVLALLETLGGEVDRVLVVGCEPAEVEERMGLSAPVAAAVGPAAAMVRELVEAARPREATAPRAGTGEVGGEG
jgi:hydrogenase maturation protease